MRILVCAQDVFTSIGGGQSFYASLFERNPHHSFYYFTTNSSLERKVVPNAHALEVSDHYRNNHSYVNLDQFTIAGRSLGPKAHDILYLLDLADSAAGMTFDVVDIPDFQPFGAAFPQALRTLGVAFDRVAVSMHGTLTAGMTDNWADILDADSRRLLGHTETMLYTGADIRYAISRRYLKQWEEKTNVSGQILDLTTLFPYAFFAELRARAKHSRSDTPPNSKQVKGVVPERLARPTEVSPPSLVFIGRQEKFKGPHLFVDIAASIPADAYDEAIMIGPEVTLGGVNSRTEIDKAALRRGLSLSGRQIQQKALWREMSVARWVSVFPSYKDTLNLAALESLMAGTPTALSVIAGLCDYLDDAFPGIPFTRIDPNDLIGARQKILGILRNYDTERDRLLSYLEATPPRSNGSTLEDIYAGAEQKAADSALYDLFAPVFEHAVTAVIERTRPILREGLSRNLLNIFRTHIENETEEGEVSEFVRRLTHAYDQAFELRRYGRELLRRSHQGGFLDDSEMEDVWHHLLPYCFTNNRVALYKLMAQIERDRSNSLIFATYAIRCLRLGGQNDESTLDEVVRILIDHGFREEAQAVRWMYGSHFDYAAATSYLKNNATRFFTPLDKAIDREIDVRHPELPKISIIVSLYNAASKLPVFFEGLRNFTEQTRNSLEIVLIDSCSPDDTADVVSALLEKHRLNGWDISLYYQRTPQRESIQRAWNRGIQASRAPYLSFLGVDEMNRSNAYDIMTAYLDANPSADWVQGSALVTEVNPQGSFVNDLMLYDRQFKSDFMQLFDTCYVGYVGALYRRTIHDRVGFYDDRFKGAGDSEFKNRALPHISIVTLPEVLGYFLNYPEERTTQSPNAEIEDLRAWYLFRTAAGIAYGFGDDTFNELNNVFYNCFSYRKSYMSQTCTDIELAVSIADFAAREGHPSFRYIFGQGASAKKILEIYRVLDLVGTVADSLSDIQFLHEVGGILERAGTLIASSMTDLANSGLTARLLFDNDNRSHQHHNLWRSRSSKVRLEAGPRFADLAGPQDLGELLSACQSRDNHVDFETAWRTNSLNQLKSLFAEQSIDIALECGMRVIEEVELALTTPRERELDPSYVLIGPPFGSLNVLPRVYVTGKVVNPRPVLAAATVVVVLNDPDSAAYTEARLLRAICMGKAVVAASAVVGAIRKRFPDFDEQAVLTANTTAQVFEAARRLLDDPEQRMTLRSRALTVAETLRRHPNCVASGGSEDGLPDQADGLRRILRHNRNLRDAFAADGLAGIQTYVSHAASDFDLVRGLASSLFTMKDAAILKTEQQGLAAILAHPSSNMF